MSSDIQEKKRLYMPKKAQIVLNPLTPARYRILYGGRGSGKSWAMANALIARSLQQKIRILCFREYQSSIRDSVHKLLTDRINALGLGHLFCIQRDSIYSNIGSEFVFKGVAQNVGELKSLENISIAWGEEAEKLTNDSLDVIIPTIRGNNSEIWMSFNPEDEKAPVWTRFVINTPPECLIDCLTFDDNHYFPEVLRKEAEYCKSVDIEKYEHIWMGKPKKYGVDLILGKKVEIREFEAPEGTRFFYGCDFGFSNDPTAAGRMFIQDECLWIDYEAYGVGVEILDLPAFLDTIPRIREWTVVADSARPETISHLYNQGFMIEGAEKGKGSVEDGIQFLRSFKKIIIHPRCTGAIGDFTNYRFKRDRHTNEILPIPKEGSDHWPDCARYALEKYIKGGVTIYDVL